MRLIRTRFSTSCWFSFIGLTQLFSAFVTTSCSVTLRRCAAPRSSTASWSIFLSTSSTCPPFCRFFSRATSFIAPNSFPCPTCQTCGCACTLVPSPCVTFSQCVVGESSFAGRRDHDSKSSIIVHLLQESIFEEIVAESLPQLIIQAINQTMNREWTTLGYISIIMSVSSFILTHHSRIPRVANICVHVPHLTRCAGRRSWP